MTNEQYWLRRDRTEKMESLYSMSYVPEDVEQWPWELKQKGEIDNDV